MYRVALEVQNSTAGAFVYLSYINAKNALFKNKIKGTNLWVKEKCQLKGPLTGSPQDNLFSHVWSPEQDEVIILSGILGGVNATNFEEKTTKTRGNMNVQREWHGKVHCKAWSWS